MLVFPSRILDAVNTRYNISAFIQVCACAKYVRVCVCTPICRYVDLEREGGREGERERDRAQGLKFYGPLRRAANCSEAGGYRPGQELSRRGFRVQSRLAPAIGASCL